MVLLCTAGEFTPATEICVVDRLFPRVCGRNSFQTDIKVKMMFKAVIDVK